MIFIISVATLIVVICVVLLTISNIYSKKTSQKVVSNTYNTIKNILIMFFFLISGIFIFVIGSNGISAFKILFNEVPVFLKLSILAMFGFIFYAREQEKSKHKEWWSKASVKEKKEYLDKIRKGLK